MNRVEVQYGEIQYAGVTVDGTGVLVRDAAGDALLVRGSTPPTGAGYATGCIFINDALTGASDAIHVNAGTPASAAFAALGVAAPVIGCAYALDNTTFAYVPGTVAWPSFSNETQTVSLPLGGADIDAIAIPTVEAGPAVTGQIPMTAGYVYYYELGISMPDTSAMSGSIYAYMNVQNAQNFSTTNITIRDLGSGKELLVLEGANPVLANLGTGALNDYRVGVYVNADTGLIGVKTATDYGYQAESALVGATSFFLGMNGRQTGVSGVTGDLTISWYTNPADFQRTPPVGARDICGNAI